MNLYGVMMIVNQLFSIARKMLVDFEQTSDIQHPLTKGEEREAVVVTEYLKKYLPGKYGVTSGEIIDSDGNVSKQQDIIIFDRLNTMPLFSLNNDSETQSRVPIENVYAVIEVKSTLSNSEIDDAIEKYNSVTSLKQYPMSVNPVFRIDTGFPAPAGFVFAFSSVGKLESLAVHLKQRRESSNLDKHITSVLVLEKGIIQYGEKGNPAALNVNPSSRNVSEILTEPEEPGEALLNFTISLNHVLNAIYLGIPNLDLYLRKSKNTHYCSEFTIPLSLLSEDMSFALQDGYRINNMKLFAMMNSVKISVEENPIKMIWDNKLASDLLRVQLYQSCVVDSSGVSLVEKSIKTDKEREYHDCTTAIARNNMDALYDLGFILSDEALLSLRVMMIKDYFLSLYESNKWPIMKMYADLVEGKDAGFIRAMADNIKTSFEQQKVS